MNSNPTLSGKCQTILTSIRRSDLSGVNFKTSPPMVAGSALASGVAGRQGKSSHVNFRRKKQKRHSPFFSVERALSDIPRTGARLNASETPALTHVRSREYVEGTVCR